MNAYCNYDAEAERYSECDGISTCRCDWFPGEEVPKHTCLNGIDVDACSCDESIDLHKRLLHALTALEITLIEGHYQTCPGRESLDGSTICSWRCKEIRQTLQENK